MPFRKDDANLRSPSQSIVSAELRLNQLISDVDPVYHRRSVEEAKTDCALEDIVLRNFRSVIGAELDIFKMNGCDRWKTFHEVR